MKNIDEPSIKENLPNIAIEGVCSDFNDILLQTKKEVESKGTPFRSMPNQLSQLNLRATLIGDTCHHFINKSEEAKPIHYLLSYQWMEKFKSFLVLWRNILFEEQKADIFLQEGKVTIDTYNKLLDRSKAIILGIIDELNTSHLDVSGDVLKKSMKAWQHQNTPWQIYKEQFETIQKQAEELLQQHDVLSKTSMMFGNIRQHAQTLSIEFIENLQEIKERVAEIITTQKEKGYTRMEMVDLIDTILLKQMNHENAEIFANSIQDLLKELPERKHISIEAKEGMLFHREMDIRKTTSNWLESEIIPLVYHAYHSYQNINNKVSLSKLSMTNRLNFEHKEGKKSELVVTPLALENLFKNIEKGHKDFSGFKKDLESSLSKELQITNIYQEEFLSLSVSSTLNQYKRYQTEGLQQVKEWIVARGKFFGKIREASRREERLSLSEKIVRVVRHRVPQSELSHYTNMFLTQGYIGDSFAVGREHEMARIGTLVANWKMGFRGTLLISGDRFSGKTFLGTMVHNQHFRNSTIKVSPNRTIRLGGRTFETGYDLKGALDFIVKYGLQSDSMIWIDDLVKWESDKVTLASNVNHLIKMMDAHSSHLFFVVSISDRLRKQLNLFYQLEKGFQSVLNIDTIPYDDAKNILFIRHRATQHNIINLKDKEELTAGQLDKAVRKVYQSSKGNIGVMLRQWSYSIMKAEDDTVAIRNDFDYLLPKFMNTETGMILRAILIYQNANEYVLLKKFGPAFQQVFKPIVSRLLGVGILKRHLDGTIEINPFLVDEIDIMIGNNLNALSEDNLPGKINI
ncbi:MAG: hypothetical protein ACI94Y_001894 [Maribacter sp.]|jgi:hypothetical protein